MSKKVLVLIPAYNEENNIRKVLRAYYQSPAAEYSDIIVIDDGSKDNTAITAKEEGAKVISQIYNMGYGAALQTGYKYALDKGYENVIQLDADGQHSIQNIEWIYNKLTIQNENEKLPDIVIGSRYLKGSQSFTMSQIRLIAVKMFRMVIKWTTGNVITDPTSGLQGLNRRAFSYYAQFNQFDIHYPDINMILQMLLLGYHVTEIPAVMHQRTEGVAMHSGVIKPIKYMILMAISSLNAILRYHRVFKIEKKRLKSAELDET